MLTPASLASVLTQLGARTEALTRPSLEYDYAFLAAAEEEAESALASKWLNVAPGSKRNCKGRQDTDERS